MTTTPMTQQYDTHSGSMPDVDFIPNQEFATLSDVEVLQIPVGATLYSDREDGGLTDVTQVGDFDCLHSLPLLSATGESFLFRKMNYLKFRAAQLRESVIGNAAVDVDQFHNLMADADAVRNHIAECNLRLVISIARKFATSQSDFDELMSEGNMILLKAIDKFDFSRGFRFSTYATHSVQRHFYRVSKQRLRRRNMEFSSSVELLNELPQPEAEVIDADTLAQEERRLKELIARMDECLDEREQLIIRERFGIGNGGNSRTLRCVAGDVGLSKERVRQVQMIALEKLRGFFGELQPELISA